MPKLNIKQTIEIAAPPEKVFETVSDFNTWSTWSPWLPAEPDAKVTVEGDGNSDGSVYTWDGEHIGSGKIVWTKVEPSSQLTADLFFFRPHKDEAKVIFELAPTANGTSVTWTMNSSLPWFLFWLAGMLKNMMHDAYARGLKMLKELVETGEVHSRTKIHGKDIVESIRMLGVRRTCATPNIGTEMENAIADLHKKLETAGIREFGSLISVYHRFCMKTKQAEFTIGYTIPDTESAASDLEECNLPTTPAFYVEHIGSYAHLGNGWSAAFHNVQARKLKRSKTPSFEVYRNSPSDTDEKDLVTDIYVPLR